MSLRLVRLPSSLGPAAAVLLAAGAGLLGTAVACGAAATATAGARPRQAAAVAGTTAAGAPVQIRQAWIRWLPADLPEGGYLTLSNPTDQTVALVGASSPDYSRIGLHRSLEHNGISRMVPVARIDIAPHSTLSFVSLGYHLMLMQPRVPIAPGNHVPVTLHFVDGRSLTVSFQVVKPGAGAPPEKSMANMPGMKTPGIKDTSH